MTGDEVLSATTAAIMGDDVREIEYLISGFHRVLYVPPPSGRVVASNRAKNVASVRALFYAVYRIMSACRRRQGVEWQYYLRGVLYQASSR